MSGSYPATSLLRAATILLLLVGFANMGPVAAQDDPAPEAPAGEAPAEQALAEETPAPQTAPSLRTQARESLSLAVRFLTDEVATEGGYLWRYASDFSWRQGEGEASETQVWVQPPGTPAVGMAFLQAWEATGDQQYLDAADAAARCLLRGQLRSGGWPYNIDFAPARRRAFNYRTSPRDQGRNNSVLDDDVTQSALCFLTRMDAALGFQDAAIHEAVAYGFAKLIEAQHPSGAWSQVYHGPVNPDDWPVVAASYPEEWSRTYPRQRYSHLPTLNDGVMRDVIETLIEAARTYDNPEYLAAAERGGDFLILAQMSEPQPTWAQQYTPDMHPAWARRFEPAAVTGGESRWAVSSLLLLYRVTGRAKYLRPVEPALDWFARSVLPDGNVARFYELRTNRPLYFTREYELTYDGSRVPTHYSFAWGNPEPSLRRQYEALIQLNDAERQASLEPRGPGAPEGMETRVTSVINAQDERGAWVERRRDLIDMRTTIRNIGTLAKYLRASRPE